MPSLPHILSALVYNDILLENNIYNPSHPWPLLAVISGNKAAEFCFAAAKAGFLIIK
ncbi:hypothetical protein PbDSM24746_59710 [Paenibacillus macerans]|uniref:Uncharacterized protein n=1 Tax=Paenibacillus macerans TaxID=44252 RepID=A0A090ZD57_PAEMA|nr:hypothetical protein DJ90_1561 [Paenibacillus macerans]GBK65967.1 hypothetical protein PbDSM24746_59710 [Paenibacillus macerans]GBK72296.1 hypothetical protein PbJCM17693_60040 [Paenibacillus macerans]GIP12477.1 hypothetical protein J1TS5_46470 [Paenibacillus macerans]